MLCCGCTLSFIVTTERHLLLIIVISNSEKACSKFTFFRHPQAKSVIRTDSLVTLIMLLQSEHS
jgi:hypothetical protein